jgi:cobalt-zinc-cadmium efflux system outer membrane protein
MIGRALLGAPTLVLLLSAAAPAQAPAITLRDAVALALAAHPDLRIADADVAIARGGVITAGTIPSNPSLNLSLGTFSRGYAGIMEHQIGVTQTVELGGKGAARSGIAEGQLRATRARRVRQRDVVAWRAERAFYLVLIAEERVLVAIEADSIAIATRTAAEDRLRLGQSTQLELNVARAAAARDRRIRFEAERERTTRLLEFRAALGAEPGDSVIPVGGVPRFDGAPALPDSLTSRALRQRADLAGLRAERDAADANLQLARALGWPDPEFGISTGRAEEFRLTFVSVSLPLPLWNRGQGQRATATAIVDRARAAEDSAERAVRREVLDALQALGSAVASLDAFDTEIIDRLSENLSLARESFEAGKISLYTYNTIRHDLVDARLAYLDALAETVDRHYALALAAGDPWE